MKWKWRYVVDIVVFIAVMKIQPLSALTGTITTSNDVPVSYAKIISKSTMNVTYTDSSGKFSFAETGTGNSLKTFEKNIKIGLNQNGMVITGIKGKKSIRVCLFDLNGRTAATFFYSSMLQNIDVPIFKNYKCNGGIMLVSITIDNERSTFMISKMFMPTISSRTEAFTLFNSELKKEGKAVSDTLIISHIRFKTLTKEVLQDASDVQIVMEPKTAPYLKLQDTDQLNSYSSTQGEDNDFSSTKLSFTDNGNGTITDNITGLIWQQNGKNEMTFADAGKYCSALELAGHHNWRLPSSWELFNIGNFDKFNPALDTSYFYSSGVEYWWSYNAGVDKVATVWIVNSGGGIGAHPITESKSAGGTRNICTRCVYGDSVPGFLIHEYTDNNNKTITDNTFGLMWQQSESGPMVWEQALSYADTLTLAGYTDWRIPNIKELHSINDDRIANPSTDKKYFPSIIASSYWSSTTQMHTPTTAWIVDFKTGLVTYKEKSQLCNVRCVRGGI
jgi:hypothetical protein